MAEEVHVGEDESILSVSKKLIAARNRLRAPTYAILKGVVIFCDEGKTSMELVGEYCERWERKERILAGSTELFSFINRELANVNRVFDAMFGGNRDANA